MPLAKWKAYRNKNRTFKFTSWYTIYVPESKKRRSEMVNKPKYQLNKMFLCNDLPEKLARIFWTDKINSFRRSLGFNVIHAFNAKEQTVLKSMKDAFEGENIQTLHRDLGHRIDIYFHDYKLATEVDKLGHNDRSIAYEIKRQEAIKKSLVVSLLELILMKKFLIFQSSQWNTQAH